MRVEIEVARSSDAEDLAQSLTAQGIQADVLTEPDRVATTADDLAVVEHALEGWTAERGLPFVPLQVDEQHVVLSPPGSWGSWKERGPGRRDRARARGRHRLGAVEPGEVLRQEQLSEQFGVSRTPIREALRRLAAQGLVSFTPNRGVPVRTLSREELREAFSCVPSSGVGDRARRAANDAGAAGGARCR